MKWLITGSCGFIGTSLIKNLVAEGGHAIRVIDNLSVGTRDDLAAACAFKEISPGKLDIEQSHKSAGNTVDVTDCSLIVGDIRDEKLAVDVTRGMDVIVHLAANTGVVPSVEDPRADCLANVLGTFNYLEAARLNGIKRFIFASSGAPAGEVEPPD